MSRWGVSDSPPDIEALSLDDLKRLVLRHLEEIAALKSEIANAGLDDVLIVTRSGRLKVIPSPTTRATL